MVTGQSGLPDLSHQGTLRYSRHLILPEVGVEGQRRLKQGSVLVIGAGGLGSPAALYLAAAGVGTIGLVDFDAVDETNLQRQIIHGTSAIGRPKLDSAAARLADVNPLIEIRRFDTQLTSANALDVLRAFDVVVDGSDNFPTRYLVNDACVLLGKPYVYGAIFRFDGQASVFAAPDGPCYRCLFRDPPPPGLVPSCSQAGVLGALPGVIGSIQALEAIKLVLGRGETLTGRLLLFDALKLEFRELSLRRDPECPVCGEHPTVRELIDYEAFCGVAAPLPAAGLEVSVSEVAQGRRDHPDLLLLDVRLPLEWEICHIEGSRLIPLAELPNRLDELDGDGEIVTVCHTGVRSLRAVELLAAAGFRNVRSMRGGVHAWAEEIDPSMPRY
jgi:adenylyltransferase/sulfurtransferase